MEIHDDIFTFSGAADCLEERDPAVRVVVPPLPRPGRTLFFQAQ
jgi:hypothetical protein